MHTAVIICIFIPHDLSFDCDILTGPIWGPKFYLCARRPIIGEREDDRLIPTGKWHLLAYLAAEKEFYRAFV